MDVLKTIAYSNSLDVMELLSEGKRFTEIENELDLNPNVVNTRLNDLRTMELVEKKNNLYKLSPYGEDVLEIVRELEEL